MSKMGSYYMELRGHVEAALQNAYDNGYKDELSLLNPDQLAADLRDCDADLNKYPVRDIVIVVAQIRSEDRYGEVYEALADNGKQ